MSCYQADSNVNISNRLQKVIAWNIKGIGDFVEVHVTNAIIKSEFVCRHM